MSNPKLLFDNRLADGVVTASSTATGFDPANVADMRPYTFWQPSVFLGNNTPYARLMVDCGAAASADSFALCSHDLVANDCSFLNLTASTDNFVSSNVSLAALELANDNPTIGQFTSASYRYFRLTFSRKSKFHGYESTFDNGYWGKTGGTATVANTAVDPYGTTTSDTFSDTSALTYGYLSKAITGINGSKIWRSSINVLKDAVGKATRFVLLYITYSGSTTENYGLTLDTSTGEILHRESALAGDVSMVDNGTHWLISITKKPADILNDTILFSFYPAAGSGALSSAYSVTTTGSCGIWNARLEIADMPSIGIAMIGNALTLPEPVENEFDPLGVQLHGSIDVSRNGNPLGRYIDYQQWEQSLTFNDTPLTWLRANWLTNWRAMRDQPMLFAWDVDNAPDDVYLVNIGDSFRAPVRSGGRCRLQFSLSGVSNV